jgi:phage/plasmid-like protein (TIGR03299 family)
MTKGFRVYTPTDDPDREAPWTTLGRDIAGSTPTEAMERGGLAFDVGLTQLEACIPHPEDDTLPKSVRTVPERFLTYRKDTLDPLGLVGNRYSVIQNRDILPVVESLVGEGWDPVSAGTLKGGAVVFMVGTMPFCSKTNEFDPYLAFVNSFDASTGLRFVNTPIRPSCVNAVQLMLSKAKASFSFRHSANIHSRVDEARTALGVATEYAKYLDEEIDKLLHIPFDEDALTREVEALIAMDIDREGNFCLNGKKLTDRQVENRRERRAAISTVWKTAPNLNDIRNTGWGWLNAVNEYEQWQYRATDQKKRAERVLAHQIRPGNTLTARAHSRLS